MQKPVEGEVDKKLSTKQNILEWVQSLVISIIVVALITVFIGRLVRVDGESMEPNLHDEDRIVTTNIHGDLKNGDIIVIKRKDAKPLVKRIIATEGQTINIDYEKCEVYVDDVLLDEPYIAEPTRNNLGLPMPATVPENHVFVMGDNRNHSDDSRNASIGMIDERNVFGKVVFRIFPFDGFGPIKNPNK